jgi:prohibitin 1
MRGKTATILGSIAGILVILVMVFIYMMTFTIGAGEVGVRYDMFGKFDIENEQGELSQTVIALEEYGEGFQIKAPWVKINTFDVRQQSMTMGGQEDFVVDGEPISASHMMYSVTNEGLSIGLDITIWFRLDPVKADAMLRNYGADNAYQEQLVRPAVRSVIRDVVAEHTAIDIYGAGKDVVQQEILERLEETLNPKYIIIEDVLLREIKLPAVLVVAIESKKAAEQAALEMEYVLQKEEQEKLRKIIEAQGIAEANSIIDKSITANWLTYYWIGVLPDANVVYIPVGENGLPIFKPVE